MEFEVTYEIFQNELYYERLIRYGVWFYLLINVNINETVTVYPNPANDLLNVSVPNFDKKKIEIRLVNLLGAPMNIVPNQKTENHFEIDVSNISTGMYILWILPEGEKPISKKLKILQND